eukprot:TRINITY_DN67927_c4_g2_i1.p1 TRINITY_DN67927_c4_g2~~TRINITY_DN67927_c4_g2_i1.p1  ORF type:complete len:1486 (-),score=295.08 TRINITY_DN67927_c4_g2_i1:135-4592(-)
MGRLRVVVLKATNLLDTDKAGGASDPFVVLKLGAKEEKTKVLNGTANPQWNEEFQFDNVSGSDALQVQVWDKDLIGKDDLGNATVKMGELREGAPVDLTLQLKGQGQLYLSCTMSGVGNQAPASAINVTIQRAEGIKDSDLIGGASDAYAVLTVEGTTQKHKTKVVSDKNNNPQWNEQFTINAAPGDTLVVELFDKDKFTKDDILSTCKFTITPQDAATGRQFTQPLATSKGKPCGTLFLCTGSGSGGGYGSSSSAGYGHTGGGGGKGKCDILVIKGTGIKGGDLIGKADVYVTLECDGQQQKTKIQEGKDPVWNERFTFDVTPSSRVKVEVWDKDKIGKDDKLGGAVLEIRSGQQKVPLDKQGYLEIEMMPTGAQSGGGGYGGGSRVGNLVVRVVNADNVQDADLLGGKSDVFVQLSIGSNTQKTDTKKGTSAPVWNRSFSFPVNTVQGQNGMEAEDLLKVQICDKDLIGKDVLGEGMVVLRDLRKGVVERRQVGLKKGGVLYLELLAEDFGIGSGGYRSGSPSRYDGAYGSRPGGSYSPTSFMSGGYGPSYATGHNNTYGVTGGYPGSHGGGYGGGYGGGMSSGPRSLDVVVVRAEGLKDADKIAGKSDPFVVLTLAGDKKQTKVSDQGTNPTFNETFTFNNVRPGERLQVEVFDKDMIGKDKLGAGYLDLNDIGPNMGQRPVRLDTQGTVFLEVIPQGGAHGMGGGRFGSSGYGSSGAAPGTRKRGNLVVRVVRADNVTDADILGGKSDVYVQLSVKDQVQKTETKKGTQHPMWNRSFGFEVNTIVQQEGWSESDDVLNIQICDKDLIGKDVLGEGTIVLRELRRGVVESRQLPLKKSGVLYLELLAEDFGRDRHVGHNFGAHQFGGGGGYGSHGGGGYGGGSSPQRVEVWLKNGENLKDTDMIGKGDPYVIFKAGGREQKSKVISGTPDPFWNEKFTFDVSPNESITVDVMDKDKIGKDDRLGGAVLDCRDVFQHQRVQRSIPVAGGRVNLEMSLVGGSGGLGGGRAGTGNLSVRVLRADNVADTDRFAGKSDVFVILTKGDQTQKTDIKDGPNPVWNKAFSFQVPTTQGPDGAYQCDDMMKVQVCDKDMIGKDVLGEGVVSLRDLKRGAVEHRQVGLKKGGVLYLEFLAEDFGRDGRSSSPYGAPSYGSSQAQPRAKVFVTIDRVGGVPREAFNNRDSVTVYLVLTLGDQSLQTRATSANRDGDGMWNEEFSCAVLQPEGLLRLQLFASGSSNGSDQLLGEATLLIQRFRGGFVHRLVVPLSNGYGGKLHMELCVASYAASLLSSSAPSMTAPLASSYRPSSPVRPTISPTPIAPRPTSPYSSLYSRPTTGVGYTDSYFPRPSSPMRMSPPPPMPERAASPYLSRIPPVGRVSPTPIRPSSPLSSTSLSTTTSTYNPYNYGAPTSAISSHYSQYRPSSPGIGGGVNIGHVASPTTAYGSHHGHGHGHGYGAPHHSYNSHASPYESSSTMQYYKRTTHSAH